MNTIDGLIVSLRKDTKQGLWMLSVELENGTVLSFSLGAGGDVPIGPKLEGLIKYAEKFVVSYPFEYGMRQVADRTLRFIVLKILGDKPVFVEVSQRTAYYMESTLKNVPTFISNEHIEIDMQKNELLETNTNMFLRNKNARISSQNYLEDIAGSVNKFWVFMTSYPTTFHDAGTFTGTISSIIWPKGVTPPKQIGKFDFGIGKQFKVKLLGMNPFNILVHPPLAEDLNRNKDAAKRYGLPLKVIEQAAEYGVASSKNIITQKKMIAVSLEWDKSNNTILLSNRSLPYGVVYSIDYSDTDEAIKAIYANKFKGLNTNKEILRLKYPDWDKVKAEYGMAIQLPLVEYQDAQQLNPNVGITTLSWKKTLGLSDPPKEGDIDKNTGILETDEETNAQIAEDKDQKKKPSAGTKTDISAQGYINNNNDSIIAYDDRFEKGKIYRDADYNEFLPWEYTHKVRIGDVMLEIPPLTIRMDKQFQNEKVKVMRSNSSLQKQVGTSRTILTMDLYLHNLESINGYEQLAYTTDSGQQVYHYLDGLRPLIAQFKKAPFLPIDNEYINESLQIHNVALRNIEISTVPDFPESMKATIILEKFDSSPYLIGQEKLGDLVNYPLLRWYYQEMLQEPDYEEPWKTYLPKVETLSNRFTFSKVDPVELANRQSVVREFRALRIPNDYKKTITNKETSTGKRYEDAKRAAKVLRHYEAYLKIRNNKDNKDYKKNRDFPVIAGRGAFGNFFAGGILNNYTPVSKYAGTNNAIAMYGEDPNHKGYSQEVPLFSQGMVSNINRADDSSAFFPIRTVSNGNTVEAALQTKNNFTKSLYKEMIDNDYQGIAQIAFLYDANIKQFKDTQSGSKRKDGSIYCLFPLINGKDGKNYITQLKKIAAYKEELEKEIEDYKTRYNSLAAEVYRTEKDMRLVPVTIPDMIPIDLVVSMENQFSTVQVQTCETPTLQYFGGQDPTIQLTFETTSDGVKATESLMREIARYVREYREAIVTGFLSIENPLLNLFGITTVLPESVSYSTIPGFPDRKTVTMVLSAFDKTQRRQEALYAYTAGNPTDEMKDRAYDNYDPAKDGYFVQEKLRQMELYPDLQLPRVKDLEKVLKYMDTRVTQYENRTNQVFLDPDFYISCKVTYRNFLQNILDDNDGVTIRWEDSTGLILNSSSKGNGPIEFPEGSQESFEKIVDATKYIDPKFEWKDYESISWASPDKESESTKDDTENSVNGGTIVKPGEFVNNDVKAYMTKKPGEAAAYTIPPKLSDWKKWSGNSNKTQKDYDKWLVSAKTEQIDETAVWKYLAKAVANNFGNLVYANDESTIISKNTPARMSVEKYYTKESSTLLGKYSWSSSQFVYSVYDELLRTKNPKIKRLSNGSKPTKTAANANEIFKTSKSSGNKSIPNYTFQRVMSFMRAIIKVESDWKQIRNGMPVAVNANEEGIKTKVGIMGVDVSSCKSLIEAQQVVWGWKRNIDKATKDMAKWYQYAMKNTYADVHGRALDWAIVSHSGVEMPEVIKNPTKKDADKAEFLKGKISPETCGYFNDVHRQFYSEYVLYRKSDANGLYVGNNGIILKEIYKMYTGSLEHAGSAGMVEKDESTFDKEMQGTQSRIFDNLLVNTWDTEKTMKSMFTDMLQTDQKGRMIRAFPSFSMQIIDEGKWFNNYRTWDNFYGYNAISSIDIYKSRKIASDTAMISMSNMYSGLSTKRKDMEFDDLVLPSFFSNVFWSQYVFDIPDKEIFEASKDVYKSMFLETGARIHLRMGYGSDARYLPVMFNGTITELTTGDVVEIVAQGDGVELTNVIAGGENDKNKNLFGVIEPSDYIGKLMTSKGNWMKDMFNEISNGQFFKDGPLGIIHFGISHQAPQGTWNPFSDDYGEATQNVYSQNGQGTRSQWQNANGDDLSLIDGLMDWRSLIGGKLFDLKSDYDEDNILVKLYNSTVWDILQTFAYCSSDYIATVHPFETRSTLFFGKPHWPISYKYDSQYVYDLATEKWTREITAEHRKSFMQAHFFDSMSSIVSNNIKASEEGIYTNVVVNFDGRQTPIIQADNDIRLDKQKTVSVEANIVGRKVPGMTYITAEAQAQIYGHSSVRDYMKDMYKGSYIVMGDPSVKPYDMCYMSDTVIDMQGIHLVKAVHHSMSLETGFITTIEPDAFVVNWDYELLQMPDKLFAIGKELAGTTVRRSASVLTGFGLASQVTKFINSWSLEGNAVVKFAMQNKFMEKIQDKVISANITNIAEYFGDDVMKSLVRQMGMTSNPAGKAALLAKMKGRVSTAKEAVTSAKTLKKAATTVMDEGAMKIGMLNLADEVLDTAKAGYLSTNASYRTAQVANTVGKGKKLTSMVGNVLTKTSVWGIILSVVIDVATASLVEMWTRRKQDAECVKIIPLQYKGSPFTAGINGHKGAVVGDNPSLQDRFMQAEFFGDDKEISEMFGSWFPKVMNFLS